MKILTKPIEHTPNIQNKHPKRPCSGSNKPNIHDPGRPKRTTFKSEEKGRRRDKTQKNQILNLKRTQKKKQTNRPPRTSENPFRPSIKSKTYNPENNATAEAYQKKPEEKRSNSKPQKQDTRKRTLKSAREQNHNK
ncbi:unnamed protein product [Amaranthus hypochondriacus]